MSGFVIFAVGFGVGYIVPICRIRYGKQCCEECERYFRPKESNSIHQHVYCSKSCELVALHKFMKEHSELTDQEVARYIVSKYK